MPQVGENLTTGVVLEWCKAEGEAVARGDVIAMVESEKAAFEVAAEEDGVLLRQDVAAGDQARVLEPIAWIGAPGEDPTQGGVRGPGRPSGRQPPGRHRPRVRRPPAPGSAGGAETAPAAGRRPSPAAETARPVRGRRSGEAAGAPVDPRARAAARESRTEPGASPSRHFRGGPRRGRMHPAATGLDPKLRSRLRGPCSRGQPPPPPRPRRLARQLLVDLSSVRGTGPGGRVVRRDVLTAALNDSGGPVPAAAAGSPPSSSRATRPAPALAAAAGRGRAHERQRPPRPPTSTSSPTSTSPRPRPCAGSWAGIRPSPSPTCWWPPRPGPCAVTSASTPTSATAASSSRRGATWDWPWPSRRGVLVPALADADRKSLAELAEARAALVESARRAAWCRRNLRRPSR